MLLFRFVNRPKTFFRAFAFLFLSLCVSCQLVPDWYCGLSSTRKKKVYISADLSRASSV